MGKVLWSEKRAAMAIVAVLSDCPLDHASLKAAASTLGSSFKGGGVWFLNGQLIDQVVARVSKNSAHKIKCDSWLAKVEGGNGRMGVIGAEECEHLLANRRSDGQEFGASFVVPDFSVVMEDAVKALEAILDKKLADIGPIAVTYVSVAYTHGTSSLSTLHRR